MQSMSLVQEKMQTTGKIPAGNGITEPLLNPCLPFAMWRRDTTSVGASQEEVVPTPSAASASLILLDFHVIVFPRYCPTNILQS